MLQALELNGFKSFANRTRFEFSAGITVVVGPNGSGKSNVVDAIKWVLGTQSVKALRGKEMTDVIFSGAKSRGQTNSAEVSLTFDNSTGVLDIDADQLQVTRRVYRSGEGEYLINRQPCRLRDIRDVFSGTGATNGAYSIIEQGKVDALLQSSPRERRLIFEEAAGISRFKLKRQEAARRLERVEQNLLRLSDIVDELDSRLRSVRSQAGKAQKYKEHSDRLRYLRTQVGLADWQKLSGDLQQLQQLADQQQSASDKVRQQVADSNQQLAALEQTADQLQQQMHNASGQAAAVRERIAQCESTRRSQLARSDELQQETQRLQRQLLAMTSRAGDAQQLVAETTAALQASEKQFDELHRRVQSQQTELDHAQEALARCRAESDDCRNDHASAYREATQLENQIHVLDSQRAAALASGERYRQQLEQAKTSRSQLAEQFSKSQSTLHSLESKTQQSHEQLTHVQNKLREDRAQLALVQGQLADLRGRLTGARERAIVLEELERRLDGLSTGTKEVLRQARDEPHGPFGGVRGVVADLLHVDADTAPLVEIALGERANQLLIEQADPLLAAMAEIQWAGRTNFLRMDVPIPASAVDRIDLSDEKGVMGRADQFVETTPDLTTLARRLLGRYWFVDSLTTAMQLAGSVGRGLNFVTLAGEVVRADGTLVVGPRQSATGLLSRRSELRALVEEIREMERTLAQQETIGDDLESSILVDEQQQQELAQRHEAFAEQLSEARLQIASLRERLDQAHQQHAAASAELSAAEEQATAAQHELDRLQQQLRDRQAELDKLEERLRLRAAQSIQWEQRAASLQGAVIDLRVALARSEQRRDGLRRQMDQLQRDHEEHDRALEETRERVTECHNQRQRLEQSVLDLSSELAELYRTKESLARQSQQLSKQHDELRGNKVEIARRVDQLREQLLERQQFLQQTELRVQQLEHQRSGLAARMLDDYDIDLAVLAASESVADLGPRAKVDAEIRTLRERLQAIGPVNLEALSELEAVEERHQSLAQQYQDLRTAELRLEQLIAQINAESRTLFVQSLDVIRGHFQELFRGLFGGGEADIVVDEGEDHDVLECGIEIIACPPGKQARNILLLSGGERTLTCVALLLAIFRSRPSPFCVLDEVDAALDEANIDRFVEVIQQFMKSTQFIVVTHSKRTMACADTLYGVTMQESGISKRVSVRFEDVTAEGHIRPSAARQDPPPTGNGAQAA